MGPLLAIQCRFGPKGHRVHIELEVAEHQIQCKWRDRQFNIISRVRQKYQTEHIFFPIHCRFWKPRGLTLEAVQQKVHHVLQIANDALTQLSPINHIKLVTYKPILFGMSIGCNRFRSLQDSINIRKVQEASLAFKKWICFSRHYYVGCFPLFVGKLIWNILQERDKFKRIF